MSSATRVSSGGRELGAAGAAVSGAGAALVAGAAAACCTPVVAPLIVALLGASGAAWAAGLEPYSPWLLAGSAALLAVGFWSAYRRPARCAVTAEAEHAPVAEEVRATRSLASRSVRVVLWVAAAAWLAALVANLVLPG